MKTTIIGYVQGGECNHCGRDLKHVVMTDTHGHIGTSCFVKMMQPVIYNGRRVKYTPTTIKDLAKWANASVKRQMANGMSADTFVFEFAEQAA